MKQNTKENLFLCGIHCIFVDPTQSKKNSLVNIDDEDGQFSNQTKNLPVIGSYHFRPN